MSKNVSHFEPHFQPKLKAEVMLDFGLIVVIHRKRSIEQRGEQISADIADLGCVAAQALEHIDHQRVIQPIKAGLHLRQWDVLSADPHGRLGGTQHIRHQPHDFIHIIGIELLAKERILNVFSDLSQIFASIHPSRFRGRGSGR